MRIIFISNFFNHHQKEISEKWYKITNHNFSFIETSSLPEERKQLGYGEEKLPSYVKKFSDVKFMSHEIDAISGNTEIYIIGLFPPKRKYHKTHSKRVIFHYSERILKKGNELLKYVPRFLKLHYYKFLNKPQYMLSASAYAVSDYRKFFLYKNRTYKWGYFPETKKYQVTSLFACKNRRIILWCGRFLDWKHPEYVIEVAKRLKNEGYDFEIHFIGTGILEENLKKKVLDYGLEDYVLFLGSMKPEQVREHMELAGIYLFTSDRQEGWGAVLNESMNSGCAVVASHEIGAVPYLLKNGENGLVYQSGNIDMLFEKVKYLLDNPDEQERLGIAAYHTIVNEWNGEVAAERFVNLVEHILNGEKYPDLYESGPCSRAEIIKEDWFYEQ